jgi:hypothetical protein
METNKNKLGLLHSYDDKPSIIDNGDKYWHINGVPSRLDITLPYIEMSNGYKEYRLENGGYKKIRKLREEWFNKIGIKHREDGPSEIWYYENGFYYTRQDYLEKIKELKSCKKMS